jgi:hypothetical protein
MKRTLIFIFLVVVVILAGKSQGLSKKLVIIRIIEFREGYTGGLSPVMHITEDDGSYRVVELEHHKKNYLISETGNQKKIHLELKKYLNEGYEIQGHTKGMETVIVWFEDYILVKD